MNSQETNQRQNLVNELHDKQQIVDHYVNLVKKQQKVNCQNVLQ